MTRFSIAGLRAPLAGWSRSPRMAARAVLAVLVAVDLIAAVIVLKPWAGSVESLEQQAASLRQELKQKQVAVNGLSEIVSKVRTARGDGDSFMSTYLLDRRTLSSALLNELDQMARKAGVKQKEVAFAFDPVEGSEELTRAEITANYEGSYADLTRFLNLLDRSPRLLIVDSLAATPQPVGQLLEVTIKLNAFVREAASPAALAVQASAGRPGRAR